MSFHIFFSFSLYLTPSLITYAHVLAEFIRRIAGKKNSDQIHRHWEWQWKKKGKRWSLQKQGWVDQANMKRDAVVEIEEKEHFLPRFLHVQYLLLIFFLFLEPFLHIMAYNVTSSNYGKINSGGSKGSYQQRQQEEHIYEGDPYYVNDRLVTRQSVGGDGRRTGGVC